MRRPCVHPGPMVYLLGGDKCGSTYLYNLVMHNSKIKGAMLYPNEENYIVKEPSFWSGLENIETKELQNLALEK